MELEMKKRMKKQSGFTLLEVMVVVVILGILASFVVPNLLGNKEKADQQKAVTDIVALENALDMYKLDNSVYPTTDQGLEALVTKPSNPEPRNYRDGGYIRRLPADPWGNEYQYLSQVTKARSISLRWVLTVKRAVKVLQLTSATGTFKTSSNFVLRGICPSLIQSEPSCYFASAIKVVLPY
ncbi:general secretion pathway protein G [Vibrio maritimus]|uniref:Type II secretion system core protein G n=1 Tax=Vibrio maritimus TaxID=990268 RepID=A0A090SV17_9VIBR|nr:general secretion pathway protein G [Vibrio maritimus]